jgi:hypothetical protein
VKMAKKSSALAKVSSSPIVKEAGPVVLLGLLAVAGYYGYQFYKTKNP